MGQGSVESVKSELPAGCPEPCRGCAHRRLTDEESRAEKGSFLGRMLAGHERIQTAGQRFGYREKARLRARWAGDRWELGFLEARKPHVRVPALIPVPDCPVHSARLKEVLK